MIDSALLWIGLAVLVGVGSLGYLVRTYVTSNELDYRGLAAALLCGAGVLELGMANGYLPATRSLNLVSGLSSAAALGIVVVAMWTGETSRTVPSDDS